jgi:diaminopimelate decarboxylase
MVLPISARYNQNGHLEVGGCDVVEAAQEFGTPLFIMDEETIRRKAQSYERSFRALDPNSEVIYASKAFICVAMCRLVKEEGLSLDVSSGGELFTAIKADFPSEKIFMHGNNKTPEELALALESGVGCVVVDSDNELDLLQRLAQNKGRKIDIYLRVTPGIRPSTHSYIQTGQIDSKFGFGLSDGRAMEAVKKALDLSALRLRGLHAHIGSQIFALHSYAKAIELIMDFVAQVKELTGFEVPELNAGGGLGIKYEATDEPSTIEEFAQVIVGNIQKEAGRLGLTRPKILIEPGRSIVGNAGITAYTIGTIKEIPGVRTYISVDGGMSDNIRPMLYGAVYQALLANKGLQQPTESVTVAGKHCESGDILVRDAKLPHPEVGDILVTPATGAYGYVMASNYNRQPKPGVIMVKDGNARIVIRRETYEDLVRLDEPLG